MIRSVMSHLNPEGQQAFDELKKRFAMWRSTTQKGKRKVPDELWSGAVKLLTWFPLSSISQSLGLDYNTLKKKAAEQQDHFTLEPLPKAEFVELSLPPFPVVKNQQIAEIVNADGATLKLYSGTIVEIIKAFRHS